jgi:hypothetical protein
VKWVKTVLWMMIFLFAIFFSLQNRDEAIVRFGLYPVVAVYWFEQRIPLFLAMLCSLFLGVLIGGFGETYSRLRLKQQLRQNKRTIERLEEEIQNLRSPIVGTGPLRNEDNMLDMRP